MLGKIFVICALVFYIVLVYASTFREEEEDLDEEKDIASEFRGFDNGNQREIGDLLFFKFWRKSFNFTGKTKRRDYWITVLQLGCIYVLFYVLFLAVYLSHDSLEEFIEFSIKSGWILAIITFIPNLAIQVRRLNDIGKEPVWVLLSFVPFLSLILIFWYAKPSLEKEVDKQLDKNLSNADELKKYADLRDQGIITEEEFQAKKKILLDL